MELPRITRLAPSPTGALHLGNARTFLANWLLARQCGWRVLLRIEDLDGPRIRSGSSGQVIEDLKWLGMNWDAGPVVQSTRAAAYRAAIDQLLQARLAYPCVCSRREAQLAASAPHADESCGVYPGTCRDRFSSVAEARAVSSREPAIRFRVPDERVSFVDDFAGLQSFDASRDLGDFVIAKADGTAAYQLAVVVDDAAMNVTNVVRGNDLIDSTPRQLLIFRALGLANQIPNYLHLPLVVGEDGRRLAKRHGDTRLSTYRDAGVTPERMLELMSRWLGMKECSSVRDMIERFDVRTISSERIVFDATADHWLRG